MAIYSISPPKWGIGNPPTPPKTSRGANFKCIVCGEAVTDKYIKSEATQGRLTAQLMAVIAESKYGRKYISPDYEQTFVYSSWKNQC
jgi:putative DNA methylase